MNQQVEQGYRMHCVLSNLSRLDVDQLDNADQERVETASNESGARETCLATDHEHAVEREAFADAGFGLPTELSSHGEHPRARRPATPADPGDRDRKPTRREAGPRERCRHGARDATHRRDRRPDCNRRLTGPAHRPHISCETPKEKPLSTI